VVLSPGIEVFHEGMKDVKTHCLRAVQHSRRKLGKEKGKGALLLGTGPITPIREAMG